MTDVTELLVDPIRLANEIWPTATGIYVRAKHEGKWGAYDIAVLDRLSLFHWLRSRGGENEWAEGVVFALLGHEQKSD